MAINFPLSPSIGQLYTFAGSTWEWSGEYWEVYSGISSSVVYSITTDTGLSADTITGNVTLLNTLPNYAGGVLTNYSGWTNNGNGTMNLPSVQVALYDNTNFLEPLRVYTVASGVTGSGGISGLTDNDTNYIYIEYNNGSPRWVVSTDNSAINGSTVVRFQNVYRIGNFIHNLEWGNEGAGLPNKIANRIDSVNRFARESGLSLGLSGSTGVVTLSSGVAWNGTLRQSLDPVNSQTDIFFQNFHSGGTWVISTTADTLNNTYYDDGTDRVVASAGTYLVNWYFRGQEINDHLYEVWGNTAYTSVAAAQLSLEPALPELITSHAFLLGRIIVEQGALTGFVETAFVTPFQPTTVQNHNDLTGLQGGSAGQYYHLNANQYNNVALSNVNNNFSTSQTINGDLNVTGDTTLNNLTANTISATTISGGTFYGDGGNLTNIVLSVSATTGLSGSSTTGNITLINTEPDQTVTISGGTGILTGGTYPNFTLENTLPDQTVTISGGTGILTGGTYPNFTLENTLPDQTVTISGGTNIEITGSYPNFGVNFTGTTTSIGDYLPLSGGTVTGDTIFTTGLTAQTLFVSAATNPVRIEGLQSGNTDTRILTSDSNGVIRYRNFSDFSGGTSNVSGDYLPLSGGTVTGGTIFQSGLTANTITATTISGGTFIGNGSGLTNVVLSVSASTGLSGSSTTGNITLINTAPDQTVTVTGGTNIEITGSYPNFGVNYTGQTSFPYLPLSGGTVSGDTIFQSGLTANTISATTISGGTLYGDGSNLTNVQNLYNIDGSLQSNRVVNLNSNSLSFSSSTTSGQTKIYSDGKVLIGKEFNTVITPGPSSEYLLSIGNDGTNNYGHALAIKPWTGNSQFYFGAQNTGAAPPLAATANLMMGAHLDYSGYLPFPDGFRLDVSAVNIPTETTPSAGLMNINFFSGVTFTNAVFNRSLLTINNGGAGIFNTPILKIFSSGNIGLNTGSESGQRLHVFSTSDPVRFEGLQVLNTDTQVVTTDANGVLHKRVYDVVTGFTYTSSSNTLTIRTSQPTTYSATINQMSGLTINGDLNVTGNYFVSGDTIVSGNTVFTGTTTYNSVPNAIGDFLTLPTSNVMSRRTAHQVRDDIGYYGLTYAIMNGYF